MESKIKSNSYNGIDLFKFIAAIFVLLLHANPFGLDTFAGRVLREVITPVAVPYFFCTSGFLWYKSYMEKGRENGKARIAHTFKMYCYWSAIYFPFVVVSWFINGGFGYQNILVYIRNFIFEGSFQTIWYLNALWSSFLIVYILLKRFTPKQILGIAIPFYVLSCLLSSWNGLMVKLPLGVEVTQLYYSIFDTTKNGLLDGFMFVAMGMVICEYKTGEKSSCAQSKSKLIAGMVCSFLLLIAEYTFRTTFFSGDRSCDIIFGTIPFTLFAMLFSFDLSLPDSVVYKKLRIYSTLMFLTQRIPLTLFGWVDALLNKVVGFTVFSRYDVVYFISVAISTFIISVILLKAANKFKFLSRLF